MTKRLIGDDRALRLVKEEASLASIENLEGIKNKRVISIFKRGIKK